MAYSLDYKNLVLDRILKGESILNISKDFSISRKTLYTWKSKGGACLKPSIRERVISFEEKRKIVELKSSNPKITLREIKERLKLSISLKSIFSYIKKENLSEPRIKISTENYKNYYSYSVEKLEYLYNKLIKTKKFKETIEERFCFFLIFYDRGIFKNALKIIKSLHRNIKKVTEVLKGKPRFNPIEFYRVLGDCYCANGIKSEGDFYYEKYLQKLDENILSNNKSNDLLGFSSLLFTSDIERSKSMALYLKREVNSILDSQIKNRVCWGIGDYYYKLGSYEEAKHYYGIVSKDTKTSKTNIAISYFAISVCEKNLNNLSKSLFFLNKAKSCNNNEDLSLAGQIEKEIGLIAFRQLRKRKAINQFLKAKKIFVSIDNEKELVITFFNMCRYYKYYKSEKNYQLYYNRIETLGKNNPKLSTKYWLEKLDNL
ncbi:MAG: hypothetical protein CR982_07315 [Candidatus Cloacimonadota bacterium]|nr:MAG: hypothetical protein CR982_07315 [Candidatus Cloacimonadota bacterium]PIE79454.1 MAG: hypothetical protein CSA15_03110 [Candidatus Delongbacteria bacterium]